MGQSIGIAVITYTAVKLLPNCLPPLFASPLSPRVLVVDSSSNDGTVELAREMGADTLKALAARQPRLIPYAALVMAARMLGYRIGYHGTKLPLSVKRRLSDQDYFWTSNFAVSRPLPAHRGAQRRPIF